MKNTKPRAVFKAEPSSLSLWKVFWRQLSVSDRFAVTEKARMYMIDIL